jgi:hypothetical protein
MIVDSESSIQKVDSDDSIVACQQDAADFFDSIGPRLPTLALQQVGGCQGYTGRAANVIANAALDHS